MCGIIAMVAKQKNGFYKGDLDLFSELLFVGQLRGVDGTGIFYNKGNTTETLKSPTPAPQLLNSKEYQDSENAIIKESFFIVGHNRAATRGKTILQNTHPFKENHITLVHNGTLRSHKELNDKVEVDSHAICHSMATVGEEQTLSKIKGAFALAWFNSRKNTLNFCRNSERPLFLLETRSLFILCSEKEMGEWICKRNNETVIKTIGLETQKIYTFKEESSNAYTEKVVSFYCSPNHFTSWNTSAHSNNQSRSFEQTYNANVSKREEVVNSKSRTSFNIGQKIKFKIVGITYQGQAGSGYLIGKLYTNPTFVDKRDRLDMDYEAGAQVRVFGNKEKLAVLYKDKHLEGKICSTFWQNGGIGYGVNADDAHIEKEGGVKKCYFCAEPISDKQERQLEGKDLCEECASILSGNSNPHVIYND